MAIDSSSFIHILEIFAAKGRDIGIPIVVLGILIFVHELGHFLLAKLNRVGVLEFALGFGPRLFRWNYGETTYTVRAIPLGGFVRMAGDDPRMMDSDLPLGNEAGGASPIEGTTELTPVQQDMIKDQNRWFLKQGYFARCAIVIAGPLFNFLFAWALSTGDIWVNGLPTGSPSLLDGPVTIGSVMEGLPAEKAGLKVGDRVVTVDGRPIGSFPELVEVVQGSAGRELAFEVERPAADPSSGTPTRVTLKVQPTSDAKELDVLEGRNTTNDTYRIGIGQGLAGIKYEPATFLQSVEAGGERVVFLTVTTLRVLKALLTRVLSPTKTIGGPLSIIQQTARAVNEGWAAVIGMMIYLNVMLGVMNLLPIPVLDGGHLTIFTIEQLKGGPLSSRFTEMATQVGMGILLLLMVFAIGNDLARLLL